MVGDDPPLCWVEDRSFLLGPGDDPLDGVFKVFRLNLGLFHTGSVQGSLIDWKKQEITLANRETRSLLYWETKRLFCRKLRKREYSKDILTKIGQVSATEAWRESGQTF